MSMHDVFVRLATIDDDNTAHAIAVALNADQDIRRWTATAEPRWDGESVKRVARVLADHAGLNRPAPRAAAVQAVADAVEQAYARPGAPVQIE